MQDPLVSVIIATYNRGKYIKRVIDSILSQNYKNIEIIVVDDSSTDNTQQVLSPYLKERKIIYLNQATRVERILARDIGIKNSKGKYIAILDSDDFWRDIDKIKKQVEFLEKNPDYVLSGGGIIKIDDSGKEILKYLPPEKDFQIRKKLIFNNMMSHSTVVFRRSALEQVGGYCKKEGKWLESAEDWNLYLKMGKIGKFYNFQEYFTYYLEAGQNESFKRIRGDLLFDQVIRRKYRKDYTGFFAAYTLGWFYYFYSLFPLRQYLDDLLRKIRKSILKY